jgi:uncharacterized protein (TIGR03118 family)
MMRPFCLSARRSHRRAAFTICACGAACAGSLLATAGAAHAQYVQTNLVSDQAGVAAHTDPNLINGWGVVFNPTGFVWVSSAGASKSTLYDGNGVPQSLVVNIPTPSASTGGSPTGIVYSGGNNFVVNNGAGGQSGAARFIWATEEGAIAGWSPNVGTPPTPSTSSFVAVDRSGVGAIYKGLAMATSGAGTRLVATDFHNRRVDVFNDDFSFNATASAGFTDPTIPAGFAPFNAKTINNKVYVTYAMQDAAGEDDVHGLGLGFINVFNTDGTLDHRLVSQGVLNSPWGMALAPANFGAFSNALLVGNFGDGLIHAYNQTTGALLGTLTAPGGQPIAIDGLWGIEFGNDLNSQPSNTLFFAAGPGDEAHGLYGRIDVPSPGTALVAASLTLALAGRRRRTG